MTSKVKVTADAAGNVVVPSANNSEYGHIRVEQTRVVFDDKGFARRKSISALIPGLIDDLKSLRWKAGQEIEGSIIAKESLTPFNTKEPERDYKVAGETGIVCCIDGQPIYRKTFYVRENNASDVFILDSNGTPLTHNNGEAIRVAYAELASKQKSSIEGNLGSLMN